MNKQLLDILYQRPDFSISSEDKPVLEFFSEYLDHGSLFLVGFEPNGIDPSFTFTNDAQRYRFTLSEIRTYYSHMKSGIAMDWGQIPFEYINKG